MKQKLKRLWNLVNDKPDFDYAETTLCVKAVIREFMPSLLTELPERELLFLISLTADFGRPEIGYGELAASKSEALARIYVLIHQYSEALV